MTVTMMATVAIHCGDPGVFHGMGLPGELAAVPAGLHQAAASDSTPLTLPPLPPPPYYSCSWHHLLSADNITMVEA